MKGKKVDTQFVSQFITNCLQRGLVSSEQIVEHTKGAIQEIDREIQRIEERKVLRSKLLDVMTVLNKPSSTGNRIADINSLVFLGVVHPHIAQYICRKIKSANLVKMDDLKCAQYPTEEIVFCVKQLLERQVLIRVEEYLAGGPMFSEYLKETQ